MGCAPLRSCFKNVARVRLVELRDPYGNGLPTMQRQSSASRIRSARSLDVKAGSSAWVNPVRMRMPPFFVIRSSSSKIFNRTVPLIFATRRSANRSLLRLQIQRQRELTCYSGLRSPLPSEELDYPYPDRERCRPPNCLAAIPRRPAPVPTSTTDQPC
jgi:hypothetical protein